MNKINVPSPFTDVEVATLKAKAESWSDANPFRARLLARLGGLHSSPPTDRESDVIEAKIAHARETAEALAEGGSPF